MKDVERGCDPNRNHHIEFIMRFQREIETLKTRLPKNKIHNTDKKLQNFTDVVEIESKKGEPSPLLHAVDVELN